MDVRAADDLLSAKLRERGQRITPQRLVIHRALAAREQHLTAEQVHESVSQALPGTSLPTVYATLELLEELGLARRIGTGGGAVLFDSRVDPHAHAVCRSCGGVADVDRTRAPAQAIERARADGFQADYAEVVIWGVCAACRARAA
jgi:Fur family transcriptional regulator, stress-responsive regulator